jgi:hypothetical protein
VACLRNTSGSLSHSSQLSLVSNFSITGELARRNALIQNHYIPNYMLRSCCQITDLPATLCCVNGYPLGANSPRCLDHSRPLTFPQFFRALTSHFNRRGGPVMLDDATWAMCVIGTGVSQANPTHSQQPNSTSTSRNSSCSSPSQPSRSTSAPVFHLLVADPHLKTDRPRFERKRNGCGGSQGSSDDPSSPRVMACDVLRPSESEQFLGVYRVDLDQHGRQSAVHYPAKRFHAFHGSIAAVSFERS